MKYTFVIDALVAAFGVAVIIAAFIRGYKNWKRLEKMCSVIVKGKITEQRTHRFFGWKYFSNTITYNHNGTKYTVNKGLFNDKYEGVSEIDVHIDPDKPEECYLIALRDRCK